MPRKIPRIDKNTTSNELRNFEAQPESVTQYQEREAARLRNPNLRKRRPPTSTSELEETSFGGTSDTVTDIVTDTVVEIPSETTALLGEAGAASALSSGIIAVDGILPTAGVILGGAVAGGLGYGLKKIVDRTKSKGAVLPYSEFIGPGNPVNIGAAKDAAEQVAKDHDVIYDNIIKEPASNKRQHLDNVLEADETAIKKFKEAGGVKGFIGETGLKVKTTLEKSIGKAIYPPYSGNYIFSFFSG